MPVVFKVFFFAFIKEDLQLLVDEIFSCFHGEVGRRIESQFCEHLHGSHLQLLASYVALIQNHLQVAHSLFATGYFMGQPSATSPLGSTDESVHHSEGSIYYILPWRYVDILD